MIDVDLTTQEKQDLGDIMEAALRMPIKTVGLRGYYAIIDGKKVVQFKCIIHWFDRKGFHKKEYLADSIAEMKTFAGKTLDLRTEQAKAIEDLI